MSTEEPQTPSKQRKWPRRLFWFILFCGLFLWLLNGPLIQVVAKHFLLKELEKQGVTGTVEVEGTLLAGLTLTNGNFTGNQGIQSLKFSSLGVSYTIQELVEHRLDHLHAHDLTLILDLKKFPEKEQKPFDLEELRKTLSLAEEIYRPIEIDIQNAHVVMIDAADIRLSSLDHATDSESTHIKGLQVSGVAGRSTPTQDLNLTWSPEDIVIDQVQLLPELKLNELRTSLASLTMLKTSAKLNILDANYAFTAPSFNELTLKQTDGVLDLAKASSLFGIESPVTGQITQLDLSRLDRTGSADLTLHDFRYQDYALKTISLKADLSKELATLTADLANDQPLLALNAQLPAQDFKTLDDLQGRFLKFNVEVPALDRLSELIKQELPTGTLSITGNHPLQSQTLDAQFQFQNGYFKLIELPALTGQVNLKDQQISTNFNATGGKDLLKVEASYLLDQQIYEYSIDGTIPLRPQLADLVQGWQFPAPLELTAKGSGNLKEEIHQSKGGIAGVLRNTTNKERTTLATRFEIDWPKSLALPTLNIANPLGEISGEAFWSENKLEVSDMHISDRTGDLLNVDGFLPLPLSTQSIDDLLKNKNPIDLTIRAREFSLARIRHLIPDLTPGIEGQLNGTMTFGGSFAQPTLDGTMAGKNWTSNQLSEVKPLDFTLIAKTENKQLFLDGKIQEGGSGFATLKGKLPITMTSWLQEKEALSLTPIDFALNIDNLELERFREALPQLKQVKGKANVNLAFKGTVSKPIFLGEARLDAERIQFENEQIPDLRDSQLKVNFDTKLITIAPSRFYGSGGEYQLSGLINLEGETPFFNVKLNAIRALIWRNDSLSLRTNGELRLAGTLEEAQLTGNLAIAESLYYKDFEIIPFGVPAGTVPEPQIPTINRTIDRGVIPVPAPFGNWSLDVGLTSKDPILIRGNLAEGQLVAKGRVRGTISRPDITLDAELQKTSADLPLSKLKIKTGTLTLRPGEGFIPKMNIRGESRIGQSRVFIFAYGKADSPKLVFTSNPPLPEAEVLTLLATGTTTSGLADQQVASVKAFQLLLSEMKRKYGGPGGNKVAGKLLDALDTVDLRVGDSDQFSGRRFNSATLQLSSKFFASAAFDDEGNSRGILIYSLRF